ncbi:MAG: XdhC family protein, partial [Planctomycetota bacterium]
MEAAVEAAARESLRTGRPLVLGFTLDDSLADEGGLICGGTVRILVERVGPPAAWAGEAAAILSAGRKGVLLARLGEAVERRLVAGADADRWLRDEKPRIEEGTFVEPLFRPRCVVLGAGHVG